MSADWYCYIPDCILSRIGTRSGETTFIEERICSHWSKFFPLRVEPFCGKSLTSRQANSKSRTLSIFENRDIFPYTLSLQKELTHIVQTCWSEYLVVEMGFAEAVSWFYIFRHFDSNDID